MNKFKKIFLYYLLMLGCFYLTSAYAIFEKKPASISLVEAILLAIRTNPNVQISQLSYTLEKFNLYVEQWQFSPHYGLQASASINKTNLPAQQNFNISPSVSWISPMGTQVGLSSSNVSTSNYNPGLSLQVMQPLMRGFGKAVVEAALNNAKDNEVIARLNIEAMLRNTVSEVIDAYLDVLSAQRTILIDEEAVKRAETSVQQTILFIHSGRKAGNELITVQANVASAKSQLENDRNNLLQTRYALLAAIGIDPNSGLTFSTLNVMKLIHQYHLPTLADTKALMLANDVQYQIDQITLYGPTKRALLIAEDNTRWQLNLTATGSIGNGSGGGENAGFNSLFNGVNQSQSVGLTLQVPIDDQVAKQAVESAKIALKEAELALIQEKWNKETNAINGWNLVMSAARALRFAEDAEKLQQKTYTISYQKYLYGLIDSLELQTAQLQLIQAQQTLLSAQINYVKSLVNVDLLTGHTLTTWNIKVRLS